MKLVLDTNALVYALQDAHSDWARVLYRVLNGEDQLCLDGRVFKEHRDVLYLPKLGFERGRVESAASEDRERGSSQGSLDSPS